MKRKSNHSAVNPLLRGSAALALAGVGAWGAVDAGLSAILTAFAAAGSGAIGLVVGAMFNPFPADSQHPTPTDAPPNEADAHLRTGFGREVLQRLPNPLILLDAAGEVVFANEAAIEVCPRAAPGAHFGEAIRNPSLLEAIEAAFDRQAAGDVDFELLSPQDVFMHAFVRPLDRDGETWRDPNMAVLVLMEDHTKGRRSEILHRDFVANASHEFKTPLASVAGFIETLQGHAKSDEQARERFLGIMAKQTDRMKRLVEDLLSLNRIELDEHVRPRDAVRLIEIARSVEAEIAPICDDRLRVEYGDEDAQVLGDRQQLSQVFLNLVDNALKYSEPDTNVVLRAASSADRPGMAGIEIFDRGDGIAPEHLTRLTERFYRVSVSRSQERGGTGLGLAIVKHILKRHRGELEIQSEPGVGSTFTVWLPRIAADGGDQRKPENQEARIPAA